MLPGGRSACALYIRSQPSQLVDHIFVAPVEMFQIGNSSLALRGQARDDHGFYRNLADHFAWDEPLAVRAEEARRNVAVMEAATESIRRGGEQLKVDI